MKTFTVLFIDADATQAIHAYVDAEDSDDAWLQTRLKSLYCDHHSCLLVGILEGVHLVEMAENQGNSLGEDLREPENNTV